VSPLVEFVGSFDGDAVLELRPGVDQRHEVGGSTARQRCCADSMRAASGAADSRSPTAMSFAVVSGLYPHPINGTGSPRYCSV
jgi:hypothetical protein